MPRSEFYSDVLCIPIEICDFFIEVFDLYEIRGTVGSQEGIRFSVRTNENNHSIPHVHAKYGEHEISIAIETAEVLAGNLPKKQEKKAQEWVISNKQKLLLDWRNIALCPSFPFHRSKLNSRD